MTTSWIKRILIAAATAAALTGAAGGAMAQDRVGPAELQLDQAGDASLTQVAWHRHDGGRHGQWGHRNHGRQHADRGWRGDRHEWRGGWRHARHDWRYDDGYLPYWPFPGWY